MTAFSERRSPDRRHYPMRHHTFGKIFIPNEPAFPLAALGFLNPLIAAASMAFSSLFVVTNSLRPRRFHLIESASVRCRWLPPGRPWRLGFKPATAWSARGNLRCRDPYQLDFGRGHAEPDRPREP
jgi:hypothetical protein